MSFHAESINPESPEEVFGWFSSPGAFQRLSPPFLPMRPAREADSLRDGEAVLQPTSPLPVVPKLVEPLAPQWLARHDPSEFVQGRRFVDRCVSQPYARLTGWVHEHTFEPVDVPGGTGTRIGDTVTARVPGSMLESMFAYRHRQFAEDMAARRRSHEFGGGDPLTVAVTGASGLVGTQLCALLTTTGHRVIRLVRRPAHDFDEREWDPAAPAPDLLQDVDVLVHLAGASIAGRFNASHMDAVYNSRVGPTRRLAELVAARGGETVMVCSSAVGYYGADRGDEVLTEENERGSDFLSKVTFDWENDCQPARDAGARVVNVRTGIVLTGAGGVLGVLATLFRTGLGGRLGDGNQWFSWIAIDDLVDALYRAMVDESLVGPVNAVSPEPVRNSELTAELGRAVRRPTLLPVPKLGPKLLLGRVGADELALADQRVAPGVLDERGHRFRYPDLRSALAHELGRESLPEPGEFLTATG